MQAIIKYLSLSKSNTETLFKQSVTEPLLQPQLVPEAPSVTDTEVPNTTVNYDDHTVALDSDDLIDTTLTNPRILVIGVSSFVGFHLTLSLDKRQCTLKLVEDKSVKNVFDEMILKRLDTLKQQRKLTIEFIDFGDQSTPKSLIDDFNPNVILYIPTGLFSYQEARTANRYFTISDFSRELKFFGNIIMNKAIDSRVILASTSSAYEPCISKVWFGSHERLLSATKASNKIQSASIIRLHKMHEGLEQQIGSQNDPNLPAWKIGDITNVFEKIIRSSKNILIDLGCSECLLHGFLKLSTTSLVDSNEERQQHSSSLPATTRRDVVMTTYFTAVKNPMHSMNYAPNKFRFMRNWFLSAKRLGLEMVMFHDQLTDEFQKQVKDFYPKIEFIKASSVGLTSQTDKRYQIYFDYIKSHQEVQNILLTDLRDVRLGHNPFEIMRTIGDYVYVGEDLPFLYSTSSYGFVYNKLKKCYPAEENGESVKLFTLFNSGVLGGSRSAILTTLGLMNAGYFKSSLNCNMPAVGIVLHKYLYEQTFSGYPFNNLFGFISAGSPGVAVMHKTGHTIYP